MTEVMGDIDRTSREDNREAERVMATSGVQPVPVEPADVQAWRAVVESLIPQIRARPSIDTELFDEMLGLLAAYRSGQPAPATASN